MNEADFATRLLRWYATHGRHDLPWQHPRDPYRVWLSEIMLQQTRVATVVPYFERFVTRFPTLPALASASLDEVLTLWSGLGYYSRGRNLHRAAQICVERYGGSLPDTFEDLVALPGIGRSTAAAILALAFGQRAAIMDGNVKRILARHAGVGGPLEQNSVSRQLWAIAEARLPTERFAEYTQALMDLGAVVCTPRRPNCHICPVSYDCVAYQTDRVSELPAIKPRKILPVRTVLFLILIDRDDRVLFERRPPQGLWGGMLGLPEYRSEDQVLADLDRRGIVIAESRHGIRYRHAFTHFKLDIDPFLVRADRIGSLPDEAHEWHPHTKIADLALPTAVRRVLERALSPNQRQLDSENADSLTPCLTSP